jgi:hypothetical protein
MHKRAAATVWLIGLAAALALGGCTKPKPVEHDTQFAVVYAELMLLQEQDKTTLHVPDSLYHVHVQGILKSHGMSEDSFRNKSALLAKDNESWRGFLADVSLVFDSLRTARQQPPK